MEEARCPTPRVSASFLCPLRRRNRFPSYLCRVAPSHQPARRFVPEDQPPLRPPRPGLQLVAHSPSPGPGQPASPRLVPPLLSTTPRRLMVAPTPPPSMISLAAPAPALRHWWLILTRLAQLLRP